MALNSSDGILTRNNIILIPYVEVNGSRLIPDDMIEKSWARALEQGLSLRVFGANKPFPEILGMLKSRGNLPVFLFERGRPEPIGWAWLNGLSQRYAFAHFLFLRESWGKHTMDMGRALVRYWFALGDPPLLDVLIGNIPSSNKSAIGFVKRLGWSVVGEIPHMAYDGAMTITYCNRSEYS